MKANASSRLNLRCLIEAMFIDIQVRWKSQWLFWRRDWSDGRLNNGRLHCDLRGSLLPILEILFLSRRLLEARQQCSFQKVVQTNVIRASIGNSCRRRKQDRYGEKANVRGHSVTTIFHWVCSIASVPSTFSMFYPTFSSTRIFLRKILVKMRTRRPRCTTTVGLKAC